MFRGLENSIIEQGPDPIIPLEHRDMKLCINVLASCRPNYLYICLDGIFRNSVFSGDNLNVPDVYIYSSLITSGESFTDEILRVASYFPVRGIFVDSDHRGISECFFDSFASAYELGYDFCLYMEDDWLITTNALQWLYDVPKIASHFSLYRWDDLIETESKDVYDQYCIDGNGYTIFKDAKYLSWGAGFPKEAYNFIENIIKGYAHYGLYEPLLPENVTRRALYSEWDRVLVAIIKHYRLLCMMPPRSLLLHYGSRTSHPGGFGNQDANRHEQIFDGDRTCWLDNLVELNNSITPDEKDKLAFRPRNFKYE